MRNYWVKTPEWLPRLFPESMIWRMPAQDKPALYLTFDDGPHPRITPWVLSQLAAAQAQATFFCIGKNVQAFPETYTRILQAGHAVGNHTQHHNNGWKTPDDIYLDQIAQASTLIHSRLFRPPYGRMRRSQIRTLTASNPDWKIIMWDVLTGDFDLRISPEACLKQTLAALSPGAIVVFHDSEKAWDRLAYTLPRILAFATEKQWALRAIL